MVAIVLITMTNAMVGRLLFAATSLDEEGDNSQHNCLEECDTPGDLHIAIEAGVLCCVGCGLVRPVVVGFDDTISRGSILSSDFARIVMVSSSSSLCGVWNNAHSWLQKEEQSTHEDILKPSLLTTSNILCCTIALKACRQMY
jgi:hypothetical protein